MTAKSTYNFWRRANSIGLFLVILYIICFAWYFIHPVEQLTHVKMLKLAYFGFDGMNTTNFVLGAIQTYVWGYIFVGIFQLVNCCRKTETSTRRGK